MEFRITERTTKYVSRRIFLNFYLESSFEFSQEISKFPFQVNCRVEAFKFKSLQENCELKVQGYCKNAVANSQ